MSLPPGRTVPLYVAPLSSEKHSKGASLGQYLTGTATFAKDELGKKADVYSFKVSRLDSAGQTHFLIVRRLLMIDFNIVVFVTPFFLIWPSHKQAN